ncbi:hypothetical protein [Acinetobacter baumannii]|uniref:hypothetical protein n=1 Tax=Acinetobacter baumannii TaxID=470 RepID=UPI000A5B9A1A|nr:hypothetical protein [Acinetobacter baumannii]EKT9247988.1 hypothetical protein [Acinetobacter baumannii]EKV8039583.1 hypothetical protein [Acinetobacter baumannii]MBE2623516.1 hypothetical protein [Acinetobacter baumannii]MBE2653636.1 hypothetical protein [Acinetobacter baumannii]MBE2664490.1 hypothetical protein [Acinetobacter baumannii]
MDLATKMPSQIEWYTKRIAFKHSIFISHSVFGCPQQLNSNSGGCSQKINNLPVY